jgi:hypothetical protein
MNRVVKVLLAINIAAAAALVFAYPHLMVAPGKLIPGHRALDTNCFACHAPMRGASSERCTACHQAADIGLRTTTGRPIAKPLTSTPFHQKLVSLDCVACHSDHAGVSRYRPQGRFSHALLQPGVREQCQSCHTAPADAMHRQVQGNCSQCHSQERWVPASFDHAKLFPLDGDHLASCATCHPRNDYSRYTCYGCHEHTPANIRGEHIEEGIRDFDNCVACHRGSGGEGLRGEGREGGGEGGED